MCLLYLVVYSAFLTQRASNNSGYCQQLDTHQRTATVREALLFSACLRQPKEVPFSEKKS